MQTTIIVATHKPYWVPDDPMYLPVQMGHAVHPACGYIGDDTGDNISERNANFCELTGLYWAAHNIDSDYIGIVPLPPLFCQPPQKPLCGQEVTCHQP